MKPYFFIFALALFSACDIINPEEDTPAFIEIKDFDAPGITSTQVVDAWVTIEGELQGIYSLPARFPVLSEGEQKIHIGGGIKKNGISASRVRYPYYKLHEETVQLQAGQTVSIQPKLAYYDNLDFPFEEDFNGAGSGFHSDLSAYGVDIVTDANLISKNQEGFAILDGDKIAFECVTDPLKLPKGKDIYLELDYKSNVPLFVNLIAFQASSAKKVNVMSLHPKNEWNKIYIYLAEHVNTQSTSEEFSLSFNIFKSDTVDTASELYLDNIRIIHNE
jgi:hypothetical protein